MNVLLAEQAYLDLEALYDWIAPDRPEAAAGVIDRIFESLDQLGAFVFIGCPGSVPGTEEWTVPGIPFVVVYEIDVPADQLLVLAVFYVRREYDDDVFVA